MLVSTFLRPGKRKDSYAAGLMCCFLAANPRHEVHNVSVHQLDSSKMTQSLRCILALVSNHLRCAANVSADT
jgi:hypothetical protein